ncbi:hypothetical protein M3Y94_00226800 [Aphelenchoides besseyi]|nr:hypothetical protein M3Y94_00226800 [Aphelenchoides besseyi]
MLHPTPGPSYVQPRNTDDAMVQEYAVMSPSYDIFTDGTGKETQTNAMDPVMKNLFDRTKAGYIYFVGTRPVNNPVLHKAFECHLAKLQKQNIKTMVTYGFIQLPNSYGGEEEDLCRYGVRTGMSFHGELGDASKGVYLSCYADTCTPTAMMPDHNMRILVCKVALGNSKRVVPHWNNNAIMPPDLKFNSHVATPISGNGYLSPVQRYKHSLIYVYDYQEDGVFADRPPMVVPISVVELQCNKPADLMNVVSPKMPSSVVWTGMLTLQKHSIKHVTMHSHSLNVGRPRGMDILQFRVFVPYDTVVAAPPINRICQEEKIGFLFQRQQIAFYDETGNTYIQYFILKCDENETFDQLCTLMRRFELVGVNRLSANSEMFLIPNGGLSIKLGFFLYNTSVFHCLVVSRRPPFNANMHLKFDIYEKRTDDPLDSETILLTKRFGVEKPLVNNSDVKDNNKEPTKAAEVPVRQPIKTPRSLYTGDNVAARPAFLLRPSSSKTPQKLVPPTDPRRSKMTTFDDSRALKSSSIIGLPRRSVQSMVSIVDTTKRSISITKPGTQDPSSSKQPTANSRPAYLTHEYKPSAPTPSSSTNTVAGTLARVSTNTTPVNIDYFKLAREKLKTNSTEEPPKKIPSKLEDHDKQIDALISGRWFDTDDSKPNDT